MLAFSGPALRPARSGSACDWLRVDGREPEPDSNALRLMLNDLIFKERMREVPRVGDYSM
jgi:hypothetical protein